MTSGTGVLKDLRFLTPTTQIHMRSTLSIPMMMSLNSVSGTSMSVGHVLENGGFASQRRFLKLDCVAAHHLPHKHVLAHA